MVTLATVVALSISSGRAAPIPPEVRQQQQERLLELQKALAQADNPADQLAISQEAMRAEKDPNVRRKLIEIVRKNGGREWESFLIGVAQDDPDAGIRGEAATLLGNGGTERALDVLLRMARTDPRTGMVMGDIGNAGTARRQAIFALAELARRLPQMKDKAVAGLQALKDLPDDNESLPDARLQALYQITGDEKLIAPFFERLKSGDPKQRQRGVVAMRFLKLHKAPPLLVTLLKDENTDVRSCTAMVLGEIGDPETVGPLMAVAEDPNVGRGTRCNAVGALGRMKATDAIPLLEKLLHDPDPSIPDNAAVALYRITGKKVAQFPEGYNAD
jgi:HEAT repeat protein